MPNKNLYIVIHPSSYSFIANVIEYIRQVLEKNLIATSQILKLKSVDDYEYPARSIIFVIGDPFKVFIRRPACFYIFINFSVLFNVSRRWFLPVSARKWLSAKRKEFFKKLHCYDMVLDYYPLQTAKLEEKIRRGNNKIMVMPFPVNVTIGEKVDRKELNDCAWDICIVGSVSPRRSRIYERLKENGYRLSPAEGKLNEILANSKVALNVHYMNCDNIELPRIIETLKVGRCLVTEYCHGLNDLIPPAFYYSCKYHDIIEVIDRIFNNPISIKESGSAASNYIRKIYDKWCEDSWQRICAAIPV